MELFERFADPAQNHLPYEGHVHYYGKIYPEKEADELLSQLLKTIAWHHDLVTLYGKTIRTRREVAWYGDHTLTYRYSGHTKMALPWTNPLIRIKNKVELESGSTFNSCLLNLYHQGNEGMSWHSDDEKELVTDGVIASVSMGAARKFSFKHKVTGERIDVLLEHGSLLIMKGLTQRHWLHQLPPTRKIKTPRINLTFRQIKGTGS